MKLKKFKIIMQNFSGIRKFFRKRASSLLNLNKNKKKLNKEKIIGFRGWKVWITYAIQEKSCKPDWKLMI